jgi:hypothetical protein
MIDAHINAENTSRSEIEAIFAHYAVKNSIIGFRRGDTPDVLGPEWQRL